jgi:predicted phosphodiesterase
MLGVPLHKLEETVGIMSDSHGRPELIEEGVRLLRGLGCGQLFHLGDICDSGMPETADECVRLVAENGMIALKGNNDHVLVINHSGKAAASASPGTLRYLRELPPVIETGDVAFTHSLPFFAEMGLSCLMRVIDDDKIDDYFSMAPYRLLFRGHGHTREAYRFDGSATRKLDLAACGDVRMEAGMRYMVTCGALTEGYALVWDRITDAIKSVNLR